MDYKNFYEMEILKTLDSDEMYVKELLDYLDEYIENANRLTKYQYLAYLARILVPPVSLEANIELSRSSATPGELGNHAISAYGTNINLANHKKNLYGKDIGTSFSAPFISAALALFLQKNPNASMDDAKKALLGSALPLGDNYIFGHGLLNIARLLNLN